MKEFVWIIFSVMGGGLFGLDIGVVGSVIDMNDFKARFEHDVWEFGLISGGMNIGAFLFCWTTSPLTKRFGRRDVIGVAALLFALFAFIQGTAYGFGHMFFGRVLSGGTIAICATVVPMYVAELAPSNIRGSLVSLNQSAIGFAIMMIYWIALSLKGRAGTGLGEDWRVCFYISAMPALVLGICIWFLPRSPRWLLTKHRIQEANHALRMCREGCSEEDIQKELEDMEKSIEREREFRDTNSSCFALCRPNTTIQSITMTAFLVQLFQQIQGINVIMYFGPMVVDGFGLNGTLFTGVVQTFNFGFTFISVFTVDRLGRRPLLLMGTGIMFLSLFLVAIIGVSNSEQREEDWVLRDKSLGYLCIMCFVAYLAAFAATWGPVGWLLPSEIFPVRHRESGMAVAAYGNWGSNALLGLFFPFMMKSAGFNTYFLFCFNCCAAAFFVYFMVPETKGVRIEEMELLFKYGEKSSKVRLAGNTGHMKNGDFDRIDVDDNDGSGLIQSSASLSGEDHHNAAVL